jgi:ammonia channel protein AmtB
MPQKPEKFGPALYGGLIMGVLSATPFLNFVNCLCCAGILLGGFMSVYFYKKALTEEMDPLTTSDTMGLGALSGVFGAVASTIIGGTIFLILGNYESRMIYNMIQSMGAFNQMPPEQAAQIEQSLTQQGFSIINVVSSFIICPLFGLLGGLIGYGVFRPRETKKTE